MKMNIGQSSENSRIIQREKIVNNRTTFKQGRARDNKQGFQPIQNDDEIINDDEEKRSPIQNQYSLRRSLLRHRELWENVESSPFQLIAISDQYYGENVSRQTLSFLQKMRNFLVKEEQILKRHRNMLIKFAHETISERFSNLKKKLTQIIQIWCEQRQIKEINNYTDVTQVSINGSLIELLSKTQRRRQQIEFKIEELKLGLSQFKRGHKQSELYHNRNIKNTVRDVLGNDYELQVKRLREEIEILVEQNSPVIPLSDSYAQMEVRLLLRSIESQLVNSEIFKSSKKQGFIKGTAKVQSLSKQSPLPQVQPQRTENQYFKMSRVRQKVLQQLLETKKRELDIQTQKFYNSIIKPTHQ